MKRNVWLQSTVAGNWEEYLQNNHLMQQIGKCNCYLLILDGWFSEIGKQTLGHLEGIFIADADRLEKN